MSADKSGYNQQRESGDENAVESFATFTAFYTILELTEHLQLPLFFIFQYFHSVVCFYVMLYLHNAATRERFRLSETV